MYIQRYIRHFPAAGEVVIFDRSWYNRAGVERVMGFCTPGADRAVPRTGAGGREGDGRLRDRAAQVLAGGQPRRADPAPGEPHRRSTQDLEALGHGPEVVQPLVRLLARPGRHVRRDRHGVGAVVRRAHRRQEARPAEHHQPPAEPDPVREARATGRDAAQATAGPAATSSRTCRCATSRHRSDRRVDGHDHARRSERRSRPVVRPRAGRGREPPRGRSAEGPDRGRGAAAIAAVRSQRPGRGEGAAGLEAVPEALLGLHADRARGRGGRQPADRRVRHLRGTGCTDPVQRVAGLPPGRQGRGCRGGSGRDDEGGRQGAARR